MVDFDDETSLRPTSTTKTRPPATTSHGCQPINLAQANNASGGDPQAAATIPTTLMPTIMPTASTLPNQQQNNYYILNQQQSLSKFDSHPYDGPINFRALFWVDRGPVIWGMQTTIAVICFIEAILMQYLTYKVSAQVNEFI